MDANPDTLGENWFNRKQLSKLLYGVLYKQHFPMNLYFHRNQNTYMCLPSHYGYSLCILLFIRVKIQLLNGIILTRIYFSHRKIKAHLEASKWTNESRYLLIHASQYFTSLQERALNSGKHGEQATWIVWFTWLISRGSLPLICCGFWLVPLTWCILFVFLLQTDSYQNKIVDMFGK